MDASRADRLDSWKEIAAYLRRSVRTVRRWEALEGLPVHRHVHRSGASVYAYRSEINSWRNRRGGEPRPSASAAPTPAANRAVGVLPFGYVGPDPALAYLADGFTEEVIAHLSKLRGLRVISRTSSMALKGGGRDLRSLGRALAVSHLVEGTVRHDGSRLRVSTRLLAAEADDRLWGETFDGTLEDVFAIQERIARGVVAALELRPSPDEDRRLAEPPAADLIAWQCVLQARQESLRWRADAIESAIRRLHHGLSVVGESADLYAALGRAHLQFREAAIDLGDEPLARAEEYARKVFALRPGSPAGLRLRGWIRYSRGDVQAAVHDLGAALESDWNDADSLALLANCYLVSGRVDAARPLVERLLAVDPLTPLNRCMPGFADAMEGHFDAAVAPYLEMLSLDPDNPLARLFTTWILAVDGRTNEAREVAAGFAPSLVGSLPQRVAALLVRAADGEPVPARDDLTAQEERLATASEMFPRFLAQAHALAGNADRAVHWLRAAVERGFVNHPFLARHDPFLRRLRDHSGFARLLGEVEERWQRFAVHGESTGTEPEGSRGWGA